MEKLKEYLIEKYGIDKGEWIYSMSKHPLEEFKKDIQEVIKEKYPHRKGRLLGTRVRIYPKLIFNRVLEHFKVVDPELCLSYEIEGVDGLRIGDVLELKVQNIDFGNHNIVAYNHKAGRWFSVPMSKKLEQDLKDFITKHETEIKGHENYIFFTRDDEHHSYRKGQHLTQQYVNRKLVAYLESIGEDPIYALRHGDNGKLHLITTHAGRAYAATNVYEKSNHNIAAVKKLLDHTPRTDSSVYIATQENELENIMRGD